MKDYRGYTVKEVIEDTRKKDIIIDHYIEVYLRAYEEETSFIPIISRNKIPKGHMVGIVIDVLIDPYVTNHISIKYRGLGMTTGVLAGLETIASKGETIFVFKQKGHKDTIIKFDYSPPLMVPIGYDIPSKIIMSVRNELKKYGIKDAPNNVNNISFMNIIENGVEKRYAIIEELSS